MAGSERRAHVLHLHRRGDTSGDAVDDACERGLLCGERRVVDEHGLVRGLIDAGAF